jgi:multisubunit Na+/H+ antiporter MnhB subunit
MHWWIWAIIGFAGFLVVAFTLVLYLLETGIKKVERKNIEG